MKTTYSYSPLPDFKKLDPYAEEICLYMCGKGEVSDSEFIEEFKPGEYIKSMGNKTIKEFKTNDRQALGSRGVRTMDKKTLRKHRDELVKQGIILTTNSGKYILRKAVSVESSNRPFKTIIEDGIMQDAIKNQYDIEEIPPRIRDVLLIPPDVKFELVTNPHLPIPLKHRLFDYYYL